MPGGMKKRKGRRQTVSVRKTTEVERTKTGLVVREAYSPKSTGKARTGYTGTAPSTAKRRRQQTGSSSVGADKQRVARAPGKRVQQKSGKTTTYYESRRNRSDANKSKRL